jgi:hypothetical protein
MKTRRRWSVLIAVVVSLVALAPRRGVAQPAVPGVDAVPIRGELSPQGAFVGYLTINYVTEDDADRVHLTGVLHGTATDRHGATIPVRQQPFTAPATVLPSDQLTDVLLLQLPPVALASVPGRLAPVPLDVDVNTRWRGSAGVAPARPVGGTRG